MRVERPRPRTRQTSVRSPAAHERDGEIATGIPPQELDGVMPLAEPYPHPVRERSLECPPTRPIKTDSADWRLDRNAAGFVERGEGSHAVSVPEGMAQVCAGMARVCAGRPNGTCRLCHLAGRNPRSAGAEHACGRSTRVADPTGSFDLLDRALSASVGVHRKLIAQVALRACATWAAAREAPGRPQAPPGRVTTRGTAPRGCQVAPARPLAGPSGCRRLVAQAVQHDVEEALDLLGVAVDSGDAAQ
jgi:hypothetical protein